MVTGGIVIFYRTQVRNWHLYDITRRLSDNAASEKVVFSFFFSHLADFPVANLTSETDRHRWVRQQLDFIQTNNLDGINIDFETPIERWERSERDGLSLIVWEMYKALKSISPYYQVNFPFDLIHC